MSTPTRISPPERVRVDASNASWRAPGSVSIVHVGQSVVTFEGSRGLVVVSSESAGLAPGGMCVRDRAEFARLRDRVSLARRNGDSVLIGHWRPLECWRTDLALATGHVASASPAALRRELARASTIRAHGAAIDVAPIRAKGRELASAAGMGTGSVRLRQVLLGLVGAGPGSTPTGDDVIVGTLAGLRVRGRDRDCETIARWLRPLLPRTTRTSQHYLEAAADGRFAERVHELAKSLADPTAIPGAVRRASEWGATSGIDLASGVLAAIEETIAPSRYHPTERHYRIA